MAGRGGAAPSATDGLAAGRTLVVPLDQIAVDFGNHRIEPPTEEAVASLARSIAEDGLLSPPLVRPYPGGRAASPGGEPYQLVFGHRRLLAVRSLRWEAVEVVLREELPEERGRVLQLRENIEREDISPVERARGMQMILDTGRATSRSALADAIGTSRSEVTKQLSLLSLPAGVQAWVHRGRLGKAHGELLARRLKGDASGQTELASRAVRESLDVRTLDAYAKEWIEARAGGAGALGGDGLAEERLPEAFFLGPTQTVELRLSPGLLPEAGEEASATDEQRLFSERLGLYAKLCAFGDRELRERELDLPVPVTPEAAGEVMDFVFDLEKEEVDALSMRLNRRYAEAGHRATRVPGSFKDRFMRAFVAEPKAGDSPSGVAPRPEGPVGASGPDGVAG